MRVEVTFAQEDRACHEYFRLLWAIIEHGTGKTEVNAKTFGDMITFTLQAENLSALIKEFISSDKGAPHASL